MGVIFWFAEKNILGANKNMRVLDGEVNPVTEVTDSISLTSPDGQEITITTKNIDGMHFVSLFVDDGINIVMVDIPRFVFDQMMFQLKPLQ